MPLIATCPELSHWNSSDGSPSLPYRECWHFPESEKQCRAQKDAIRVAKPAWLIGWSPPTWSGEQVKSRTNGLDEDNSIFITFSRRICCTGFPFIGKLCFVPVYFKHAWNRVNQDQKCLAGFWWFCLPGKVLEGSLGCIKSKLPSMSQLSLYLEDWNAGFWTGLL